MNTTITARQSRNRGQEGLTAEHAENSLPPGSASAYSACSAVYVFPEDSSQPANNFHYCSAKETFMDLDGTELQKAFLGCRNGTRHLFKSIKRLFPALCLCGLALGAFGQGLVRLANQLARAGSCQR
ncbi:MAG: hypothetical protein NT154_16040 [Verrucomicrobia bacterium]|nr:hypothetical protein [Verrucomicrobiota bacterium]